MRDDDRYGPPRRPRRPPERSSRGGRGRFDEYADDGNADDDYDDDDRDERPRRRGGRRPAPAGRGRRRQQRKEGFFARLFGGGGGKSRAGRSSGRDGFDWGAADDDYDDRDEWGEEPERYEDRGQREAARRAPKRKPTRLTLMELCTPVFGCAAILPHDEGGEHPPYDSFRQQVVSAIKRIEDESARHGIEAEDAREAAYALCFFIDEQVAESVWQSREQWSGEPLGIMIQQDPEGGVNFFRRLEELGERQKAVKEVLLVCLAMGFRGKYAEHEVTEQAAEIGRIRHGLVRSVYPTSIDKQPHLFPAGYSEAGFIEEDVPPPPRWWGIASVATICVVLLIYVLLIFLAGRSPNEAIEVLGAVPVESAHATAPLDATRATGGRA